MKYKIAICDDSDADRQYVLNMVNTWAAQIGHAVHTDTFSSAENFLFHYSEESDYDILLLDIEMEAMDGVTMAKQLRKSNDTVQIVFITLYEGAVIQQGTHAELVADVTGKYYELWHAQAQYYA